MHDDGGLALNDMPMSIVGVVLGILVPRMSHLLWRGILSVISSLLAKVHVQGTLVTYMELCYQESRPPNS